MTAPQHARFNGIGPLFALFNLPDVGERVDQVDGAHLTERADAMSKSWRDAYLQSHAEAYGDKRDFACTFTQKTHDQIQGQISGVYADLITIQAIIYSYLELALARIDQMEAERLAYDGVYAAGKTYRKGSLVTWGGSCWHANKETDAKPGDDADRESWTLMVKRGRDGKDVRNAA